MELDIRAVQKEFNQCLKKRSGAGVLRRFTLLLALIFGSPSASAVIFVEDIRPDFAAYRAGVPEGAVLKSWRAGTQTKDLESVFELWHLALTVSPSNAVTLSGVVVVAMARLWSGTPRPWPRMYALAM